MKRSVFEFTIVGETIASKKPHGVDTKLIYCHEHAQVTILSLQSHEYFKRNIPPVDVYFHIPEDREKVEVGGEKREVCNDTIVHSPAKKYIVGTISQNKPLRIMVAKVSKPKESAILL